MVVSELRMALSSGHRSIPRGVQGTRSLLPSEGCALHWPCPFSVLCFCSLCVCVSVLTGSPPGAGSRLDRDQ